MLFTMAATVTPYTAAAVTPEPPLDLLCDARWLDGGVLTFSVGDSSWLVDFACSLYQRLPRGHDAERARLFGSWHRYVDLAWDDSGGFAITDASSRRRLRVSIPVTNGSR
jgi:hypothetical protein